MKKLALGVLAAWTAACGGATPPTSGPPPSAARIATSSEAAPAAASPGAAEVAADPNRELARIRLAQPEATVRKALALFPQYVPSIARDLRRFAEVGVGSKVAGVLAFDRPIEIRFFPHNPNPSMVFVGEVRKGVDARADLSKGLRVEEMRDGRLEIRPSNPFAIDLGLAKECELAFSGKVETVSCGTVDGLLNRVRGSRPTSQGAARDVAIELDLETFKPQMMKGMRATKTAPEPGDDEPGRAAGRAFGEEGVRLFVQDLRSMDMTASLSEDAVTAAVTLHFNEGRSLFHRLLGSTEPAAPPPPRFFRLPVDSDMASFSRGVDAKTWEPVKKPLLDSAMTGMTCDAEYPEPIVMEARRWLGEILMTGGPWIIGLGRQTSAIRDVLKTKQAARVAPEERKILFGRALKQWTIVGLDEPSDAFLAKVKGFVDFDARARRASKPRPAASVAAGSDRRCRTSTTRLAPAPAQLPPGTLHVVTRSVLADQPKNDKLAQTTHVFVVPEGDHVWIGAGADDKIVLSHVKSVLEGQPTSGTLAARPGLDTLSRAPPLTAGGFFTLSSLLGLADNIATAPPSTLSDEIKYFGSLTSKGNAPYAIAIRRGHDASPELTLEASASPRALDELIGFAQLSR